MNIAFVGKFQNLHDEEYIARSFEMLGHQVTRISQALSPPNIEEMIASKDHDIVLFTKWNYHNYLERILSEHTTVCWVFDLFFDYVREKYVPNLNYFRADYVFSTDGGHEEKWKKYGINHKCIRQGIYREECYLSTVDNYEYEVVFVGSQNIHFTKRNKLMEKLEDRYNFHWFGRNNTEEIRGKDLNDLYAETKVVVGDSVYSPHYWSNRVVETLGRGGFLIHQDVPGLKEEYPYLVTYERGNQQDLFDKIDYYLENDAERKEIVLKNFKWVRDNYTMEKKCAKLLNETSK